MGWPRATDLTRAHPGPAPFGRPYGRRLRRPATDLTRAHPGPAPFGRPCGRRLRRPACALTRAHPGPAPFGRPCGRRLRRPASAFARNVVIACHAPAVPPTALDTFRALFQNQAASMTLLHVR